MSLKWSWNQLPCNIKFHSKQSANPSNLMIVFQDLFPLTILQSLMLSVTPKSKKISNMIFLSVYSGWNKSVSDGLRRYGDELRQENGVGEPLFQQRGLWTLRSGKGEKTFLRRRNNKLTLTSRCSSSCSCSSWSESSLLLQRSLWQTLPLSNPLGKNRSLLFFFRQNVSFCGCWRRTSDE